MDYGGVSEDCVVYKEKTKYCTFSCDSLEMEMEVYKCKANSLAVPVTR